MEAGFPSLRPRVPTNTIYKASSNLTSDCMLPPRSGSLLWTPGLDHPTLRLSDLHDCSSLSTGPAALHLPTPDHEANGLRGSALFGPISFPGFPHLTQNLTHPQSIRILFVDTTAQMKFPWLSGKGGKRIHSTGKQTRV